MEKINVEFNGGQSRFGYEAVNYMMANVNGIELYAEAPADDQDEFAGYDDLKTEIIYQAKAKGIAPESLVFWLDE